MFVGDLGCLVHGRSQGAFSREVLRCVDYFDVRAATFYLIVEPRRVAGSYINFNLVGECRIPSPPRKGE